MTEKTDPRREHLKRLMESGTISLLPSNSPWIKAMRDELMQYPRGYEPGTTPYQRSSHAFAMLPANTIIGYYELATDKEYPYAGVRITSVRRAVELEATGAENVHIVLHDDNILAIACYDVLAEVRAISRSRWEGDTLPDGWTKPVAAPEPLPIAGERTPYVEGVFAQMRDFAALREFIVFLKSLRARR